MTKEEMREMLAKLDRSQVTVTKLPSGQAEGADDLANWAHRRATGRSGVPTEVKLWRRCEVCRTTYPAKIASSAKIDLFRFCECCGRPRKMRLVRSKVVRTARDGCTV